VDGVSLSTHVLDAVAGRPAAGVRVVLEQQAGDGWTARADRLTDDDGRIPDLAAATEAGTYRLRFDVDSYSTFFPEVTVLFRVSDPTAHHHVPLLLSPYAYSTYRGS
jgi:5-hydroxyisourate hydrolase